MKNLIFKKSVLFACALCFMCNNSNVNAEIRNSKSQFEFNTKNTPRDNNKKAQDQNDRVVRSAQAMHENNAAFNDLNKSLDILLGGDRSEKTEVNFLNNLNKQVEKQVAINTFKTNFASAVVAGQKLPDKTFDALRNIATSDIKFTADLQKNLEAKSRELGNAETLKKRQKELLDILKDENRKDKPLSEYYEIGKLLNNRKNLDKALSVLNEVCNGVCNAK